MSGPKDADDLRAYFTDGRFVDDVIAESARRRADPLPFALEALEDLFRYEDDDQGGFARFDRKMREFIVWADDAVACLEPVAASPPVDLALRLRERGLAVWVEGPDGGLVFGDKEALVAWFHRVVARLRAMLDQYVAEKLAARDGQSTGGGDR